MNSILVSLALVFLLPAVLLAGQQLSTNDSTPAQTELAGSLGTADGSESVTEATGAQAREAQKEEPERVIPDDPSIQIVAKLRCHTMLSGNQSGGDACTLSTSQAVAFDADLKKSAGISEEALKAVTELVIAAMQTEDRFKHSFGALIHLVRYEDPKQNQTSGVEREIWLTCNKGGKDPFHKNRFECGTSLRLYGRHNVAVFFVHTNIQLTTKGKIDTQAILQQEDVAYYGLAKAKLPIYLEHLRDILRSKSDYRATGAVNERVALFGSGFFYEMPVPSNLTVLGVRSQRRDGVKSLERVGSKTELLNEGLYFIDFSLGIPINKLSALEFSSADGSFAPKEINRQSAYALASVYFLPVDLAAGTRRFWMPRAVVGLNITGTPWDSMLVGGALGPPFLQFFVGSEFAKRQFPTLNGTEQRYRSHLSYGINVPILSALQKLKAKKTGE